MKFLLDSCISKFAVETLREKGFEVLWIPEIGEDPGDETIIKRAFEENFVLVTLDKDFGELIFVFNKQASFCNNQIGGYSTAAAGGNIIESD